MSNRQILLVGLDVDEVERAGTIDDALARIDAREYAVAIVADAATAARLRTSERGRRLRVVIADAPDEAGARQGKLISTLAHDLRNPLSAIATGVELVRLKVPDADVHKAIDRLGSAAKRMAAMIDQLSELARATAGNVDPPARQAADLGELARTACAQVRTERKFDVQTEGDVRAAVDPLRVTTALAGVLDDVARRGDRGAPIGVRVDGHNGEIEIEITGGAPAGEASELRVYLARNAIEAHGGTLAIDPSALVTIVLPRRGP